MSGTGEKYTDENAEADFNSGFTDPTKGGPALTKTDGEEGDDNANGGTDGNENADGADNGGNADGAGNSDGETGSEGNQADGADKPEGSADAGGNASEETVVVTKAQLDRLLAAADKVDGVEGKIEKLFGTTGDLRSIVKNLQEATPKGMKVEIPADAFKELEEEYPEIADRMRKGLEKTLSGLKGTGDDKPAGGTDDKVGAALKPEAIQAIVEDSVTRREMKGLEEDHPDWRKDVGLTDAKGTVDMKHPFRVWLDKQPADYKEKVNKTDSPLVVSRALDKFKAFSATQKKQPSAQPSKKAVARNGRIEDAVTPRGDGGQPRNRKTMDDEFNEGFKSG